MFFLYNIQLEKLKNEYQIQGEENLFQQNNFSVGFNSNYSDSTKEGFKEGELDSLFYSDFDGKEFSEDSIVVIDSMLIDSTARLEYFRYSREDFPYTTVKRKKQSKFFAHPSPSIYTRTIKIDSTGRYVELIEKISNQKTKIALRIPIEDYIAARLEARERELWEELGYKYELRDVTRDLGSLIKDFTDFEIPLPSVGVLSIFGPPKISLKIGGAVDIHGAWRNETTEGVTASRLGNTRNEPDFRQQVQINVNGTIGDKLLIGADWNTERTFEYENQLKLKYTGYEDEIIQVIEAGNVSLQTSPLVGGSEALFGVKADFKMGPLTLTALASQKKGEIKEVSVSGGSTSQDFNIRAYQYSKNHYFLDSVYADTTNKQELDLFNKYFGSAGLIVNNTYLVKSIEVWKSTNQLRPDPRERNGNAYIRLPVIPANGVYPASFKSDNVSEIPGEIESGRFIRLEENIDYTLHPETGFISFKTNVQDNEIVAVAYRFENGPGNQDDLQYGEFTVNSADTSQRLVLKLIKPKNLRPQDRAAWRLQLKNIYPIGGRDIKREGFELDIRFEQEGGEPVNQLGEAKLLNAFGLDLYDEGLTQRLPIGDGKFDFRPGLTIIPLTGEIIFPTLQPFGRNIPQSIPNANDLRYLSVYDTNTTFAQQDKSKDKFIITGKYSGSASSTYQLGFNVVENSVRVLLNGRELSRGADYSVDYNIGQLIIRNDAALVPGADLRITYEQNDLFQLASKTLLGLRGIIDFSKKTKLGFSALNLNQQTLSDKVRLGEEPISNSIYGLDFQTAGDLPFITKALDNIISTREMSSFNLRMEGAYMSPDPNTKKSTVESDKGQSIAYIDDFEGAKRTIPVGVGYTSWKDLSVPDSISVISDSTKLVQMNYKAKSFWFNFLPSDVTVRSIWGDRKKVATGEEQITVLDYVFLPDRKGPYNYNPQLGNKKLAWGGIMKILSSTATNLVEENIEFIEFWLKNTSAEQNAKIFIDLGKISEDVIPNGRLDTEDKNGNDLIDDGEDTGLDGLFDPQEQINFGSSEADPSGDNFFYRASSPPSIFDFLNINGTEGNAALTDVGRFPDTEDLNRNGFLDQINSYFRYEIPLDTNSATNSYIAGGGDNEGWFLYRIPLKEFKRTIGDPDFTNVEFIRLFVTGVEEMVHIRMAEFNLVGNQWQKLIKEDEVLTVSVVNIEDNPEYTSPPGVNRERDRSRPDQDILRNEQSLSMIIKDLPDGEHREAVKYLFRPLDVFNYKEMKLFIHGDQNQSPGSVSYYVDEDNYSADVYFRFGSDTNNYYEYRQPVRSGWNEISILFTELTSIKEGRDSVNQIVRIPVAGLPGHFYQVKGNPTLTGIRFLSVGIFNNNNPAVIGVISGEVWINELRVVGADDTPGWAYSAAASIKFADLLNVSLNMSRTDPYFHKLTDRFGSRNDSRNWGVSADLDVLKLLPVNLPGSNLKLSYSHTESFSKPIYIPGTDVKVDEAVAKLEQKLISEGVDAETASKAGEDLRIQTETMNISDTYSASGIKLQIPSSHWLIRDTFNALTFGFNYNKTFSRNPTTTYNKSWVWNASINYALSLSPDYHFFPANIPVAGLPLTFLSDYRNVKVFFTPQTFSWNISARRNQSDNLSRQQGLISPNQVVSRDFTATRGFNFAWKITEGGFLNLSVNYNVDINSSLAYLITDEFGLKRNESEIWKEIFSGVFFGRDNRYQQSFDLRTQPRLPALWDINKFFNVTAGYNVTYQWQNNFTQEELGRSGGFANRMNFGITARIKSLFAPLFTDSQVQTSTTTTTQTGRGRGRENEIPKVPSEEEKLKNPLTADSLNINSNDSLLVKDESPAKPSALNNVLMLLKNLSKTILFDYETVSFTFSQDNSFSSSGLRSEGTGLKNFWGFSTNNKNGPSRLYMLGLSTDAGLRAPNGNLSDNFSQKNAIEFKTQRPLWEGAKIDLNWKVGWSLNKTATIQTDADGNLFVSNLNSTGTIDRSFLTFPPVLVFSVFKSGIKKVNELFNPDAPNATQNLSDAFVEGFETFPLVSKLPFFQEVLKYIPRPNWRLTWDGLEKLGIFSGFAKRVSLDHSYNSTYREGWKLSPDGIQEIQTQKIEYGFQPLMGMNITFNEMWGGNLIGNVKYGVRSAFDLGATTRNITETFSRDIGITFGYSKSGFDLPLFGIALKNDIEFTFSYTNTKSSTVLFDMRRFTEEGTPQDGTTRTTIEPRIKYIISSRVSLSIFYKLSKTEPEGASRIPATTTNEAGLDVRITIQ